MLNIPSIINYIKNDVYDNHNKKLAEENNIDLAIIDAASIDCCFNISKECVIKRLIKDIHIEGCYTLSDYIDFFSNNTDTPYYKYCIDYITAYDLCSEYYHNNLYPSDIVQLMEGEITDIDKFMDIDSLEMKGAHCKASTLGKINRCAWNIEVRDFLKDNNYDLDLAQKKFNWRNTTKNKWRFRLNDVIHQYDNVRIVYGHFPIVNGVPLIDLEKESIIFINIDITDNYIKKLVNRTTYIQREFLKSLLDNDPRIDERQKFLQEELNEIYDKLIEDKLPSNCILYKDVLTTMKNSALLLKNFYQEQSWVKLLNKYYIRRI